jgi:hypothetical protein
MLIAAVPDRNGNLAPNPNPKIGAIVFEKHRQRLERCTLAI